jgi:hypothetical protein
VRLVKQLGLPELTDQQVEEVSLIAEEAARKYVLSKVPSKKIEALNICSETEGTGPVTLTIEVDITLSPSMKSFDVKKIADEAVKEAFVVAEKQLRELTCHSQK